MAKKKELRNFIISIAVLAALIVVYLVVLDKADAYAKKDLQRGQMLLDLTLYDMKEVSYTDVDGESVDIIYDGETFTSADGGKVNQSVARAMFLGFLDVGLYNTIENVTEEKLSDYGLDEPVMDVTITDKNGNAVRLTIGRENTVNNKMYVYKNGDRGTVYACSMSIVAGTSYRKADLIEQDGAS